MLKTVDDYWNELTQKGGQTFKQDIADVLKGRDAEFLAIMQKMKADTQKLFDAFVGPPENVTLLSALANKLVTLSELIELIKNNGK